MNDDKGFEILVPTGPNAPKPIPRKLMRLIEKLEDTDHCMGCRREYRDREACYVGRGANRRLLQVGECCVDRLLVSVIALSVYFAPKPAPPWAADDRDWFAAHLDRSHRLREVFPGEFSDTAGTHVVVEQMEPGMRMRLQINLPALWAPEVGEEPPEEALWALFEVLQEARKKGHTMVRMAAVLERWRTLERSGRS